jgi:moderate conductance mechanosensitive channel
VITVLAITPLTDVSVWVRGNGLEVILLVLGALLLSRFVAWLRDRITSRMEAARDENELVRSEGSKHREALAQIVTGSPPSRSGRSRWHWSSSASAFPSRA